MIRPCHLSCGKDTQAGMEGAHCCAISYAVQTWCSVEEQNDIDDWTWSINAAPCTCPLSFLMGLQRFSSNSAGGSVMVCLLVSMVPCLIRNSAISWYACSTTCVINRAYCDRYGMMLDPAMFCMLMSMLLECQTCMHCNESACPERCICLAHLCRRASFIYKQQITP